VPEPPAYLSGHGRAEWERLAPEVFRLGLLTVVDLHLFGAYCKTYGIWRNAQEALARVAEDDPAFGGLVVRTRKGNAMVNPLYWTARGAASDLVQIAGEFGFTPVARARIAAGPFGPPDAPSKFLGLIPGRSDWDGGGPAA
jgi:P27 family predicted phage terminase small subunit